MERRLLVHVEDPLEKTKVLRTSRGRTFHLPLSGKAHRAVMGEIAEFKQEIEEFQRSDEIDQNRLLYVHESLKMLQFVLEENKKLLDSFRRRLSIVK